MGIMQWLLAGIVMINTYFVVGLFYSLRINDVVDSTPVSGQQAANPVHWHLFGQASDEGKVSGSQLAVKLVGISLAVPLASSEVLLELASGETRVFKLGEKLPQGGEIRRITADSVVIWANGREERLQLPTLESE